MQTRSFVYVSDVVDAIVKHITLRNTSIQVEHVTSKEQYHVADIAAALSKLARVHFGLQPHVMFVDALNEPDSVLFEPSYETRVSVIDGLQKTLQWYAGEYHAEQCFRA